MFQHLSQIGFFPEEVVKFIIAQLAMALGYLHSNQVVYRDLKLENVLLNEDGYISLVDFGISKKLETNDENFFQKSRISQMLSKPREMRTFSVRGTPEYMAPEMLGKDGHSYPVDWWALGTVTYELLVGQPPFFEEDQAAMFERIKKDKDIQFPSDISISKECQDFIKRLLFKNPDKRLGKNGFVEIMQHPFFKSIDFPLLQNKSLPSPFKPQLSDDIFDVSNFDEELTQVTQAEDMRVSVAK